MAALRIDKWLCFARLVKTRSRAAALCAEGVVAVNGSAVRRASQPVRQGDVIVLPIGRHRWRAVRVLAFAERREAFAKASLIYEEVPLPREVVSMLEGDVELCEGNRPR